jgi:hypothetical protein
MRDKLVAEADTHKTSNTNTHSGLEAAISANKRLHTYASDLTATRFVATCKHYIHTATKEY